MLCLRSVQIYFEKYFGCKFRMEHNFFYFLIFNFLFPNSLMLYGSAWAMKDKQF